MSNVPSLKPWTDDELRGELKRREEEARIPTEKASIDWSEVRKQAVEYVHARAEGLDGLGNGAHDAEHYIFTAVIEAVYGVEVWPWINRRLR